MVIFEKIKRCKTLLYVELLIRLRNVQFSRNLWCFIVNRLIFGFIANRLNLILSRQICFCFHLQQVNFWHRHHQEKIPFIGHPNFVSKGWWDSFSGLFRAAGGCPRENRQCTKILQSYNYLIRKSPYRVTFLEPYFVRSCKIPIRNLLW